MSLLPTAHEFLALVECETGYPVKVLEEPNLSTFATVRMACGNVPAHFVLYKPTRDEGLDYMICLQCGLVLRLFDNPPGQRFRFAGTDEREREVLGMNGLDVNDPAAKYRLKSLPGEFSGLQLVAIEYVAFQQFAPDQDIGLDLWSEYRKALEIYEKRADLGG